jgi:hypothetical protein
MPKPQDLRDRVIDAVEGARRAAGRRRVIMRSANPWLSNGLSGLNGMARESLLDTAAIELRS